LPKLSIKVWNASVRYFSVTGTTPDELNESGSRNITKDRKGERHPDAFAYVESQFETLEPITTTVGTNCTITGLSGKVTYRVTAPRWTKPARVHPALLAWWKQVLEHTRWHEEQHVRITQGSLDTLRGRLIGQRCVLAPLIMTRWAMDLTAAQRAFDESEYAWWEAYPYEGPLDW
jgi:predicted secreted Zn-dependent protease